MTGENLPDKGKKPEDDSIRDWRDPSKPRNPEDDVIVDGWRRRADGTFEKVEKKDEQDEEEQ